MDNSKESFSILDAYYINELQEALNQLRAQMLPVLDAQKAMQEHAQQVIQQITDIQKSRQEEFDLAFQQWREVIDQLQQRFNESSFVTQEALITLGKQGWFVDPEGMTDEFVLWLIDNFTNENRIKAENTLVEHFDSRLSEIEASIIVKFPSREHLISAAFRAHRRQEYELSIPVLLSQTDGICKEVINQYLFKKYNKKPCTAIYIEKIAANTYTLALLSPLTKTLPINASENERLEDNNMLNRHTVLHGESLDYGNKINSLKAISLLNYVAHVLEYK